MNKKIAMFWVFAFVVSLYFNFDYPSKVEAITQFPPASLLQPGDITTSHIRDGTILPADLSQTDARYWDLKGDLNVAGPASTTGDVNVGGNLTIVGTCSGCSGSILTKNIVAFEPLVAGDAVAFVGTAATNTDLLYNAAEDALVGFGQTTSPRVAQQFATTSDTHANAVTVRVAKQGSPTDTLYITIQGDSANTPDGVAIASTTIEMTTLTTSGVDYTLNLNTPIRIARLTKYWIVMVRSGAQDGVNFPLMDTLTSGTYALGMHKFYQSGAWQADSGRDMGFDFRFRMEAGRLYRATAFDANRSTGFIGFANATIASGASGAIGISGDVAGFSGHATGTQLYLGNELGAATTTVGFVSRKVGIATSPTTVLITNNW